MRYYNDVADDVKPRGYDNSGRAESARRTRRAVVAAARDLFLEIGYPATTLTAVASRAGVSVQTVYFQFGKKRTLLKEVVDQAVAGDDEPTPISEREWVQQILDEPDPHAKLRLHAHAVTGIMQRAEPINRMLRSAAVVDADAAEESSKGDRQRLAGMRELADHLHDRGQLRPDLSPAEAAERIAVLINPENYRLTVADHGWTPEQYEGWLSELLIASLLAGR
jgi:AcrR family transcriptional regulator